MTPSLHAEQRFEQRFSHLSMEEELCTLRKLKRREVKALQDSCALNSKHITRKGHSMNGRQYRISDNNVVFVLSPKMDTVITVMSQ